MSKTSNPAADLPMETIDQAYFEKFADAALLLKAWEVVSEAIDVICDGVKIRTEDDTHVGLIEAYWALKVLFQRKTGADAKEVSEQHWTKMRQALLNGEPAGQLVIPSLIPPSELLDPMHFDQFNDLTLACMAFNASDAGQTSLLAADHKLSQDDFRSAVVPLSNSLTALRVLVIRMSGGTISDVESILKSQCRPEGETLQ